MVFSSHEEGFDDNSCTSKTDVPFVISRPKNQLSPVVYASPHSGKNYLDSFIISSSLDPVYLRRSEDAFVDELYESCIKFGSPFLKANYPRAYVDLNREPYELDPDMFDGPLPSYVNVDSLRAQAGLGTIAKVVTNGVEIYKERLQFDEVKNRIETIYHPYHAALRQLIEETRQQFGGCLLVDCHSMPSIGGPMDSDPGLSRTDIILGNRFGTSCADWITDWAQSVLEKEGFVVRKNRPYAGGFTTQHYGNPFDKVHTLQIELNRVLYMDEESVTRLEEIETIKKKLQSLIEAFSTIDPTRL